MAPAMAFAPDWVKPAPCAGAHYRARGLRPSGHTAGPGVPLLRSASFRQFARVERPPHKRLVTSCELSETHGLCGSLAPLGNVAPACLGHLWPWSGSFQLSGWAESSHAQLVAPPRVLETPPVLTPCAARRAAPRLVGGA